MKEDRCYGTGLEEMEEDDAVEDESKSVDAKMKEFAELAIRAYDRCDGKSLGETCSKYHDWAESTPWLKNLNDGSMTLDDFLSYRLNVDIWSRICDLDRPERDASDVFLAMMKLEKRHGYSGDRSHTDSIARL